MFGTEFLKSDYINLCLNVIKLKGFIAIATIASASTISCLLIRIGTRLISKRFSYIA